MNIVRPGCCGRPLISQGLLADARAHLERVVDGLFPIASRGERYYSGELSCTIFSEGATRLHCQ